MSGARTVGLTWVALLVLLGLTTGGAYLPLGRYNLPLSLAIAALKAALVLVVFMQLRRGPVLARGFIAAGFLWLGILLWLAMDDYATRPVALPLQTGGAFSSAAGMSSTSPDHVKLRAP